MESILAVTPVICQPIACLRDTYIHTYIRIYVYLNLHLHTNTLHVTYAYTYRDRHHLRGKGGTTKHWAIYTHLLIASTLLPHVNIL